jgi:hypothetical protein
MASGTKERPGAQPAPFPLNPGLGAGPINGEAGQFVPGAAPLGADVASSTSSILPGDVVRRMLATLEGECSRFFVPERSAISPWGIVEIAIILLTKIHPYRGIVTRWTWLRWRSGG